MSFTAKIGTFVDSDGQYKPNAVNKKFETSAEYNITIKSQQGSNPINLVVSLKVDDVTAIMNSTWAYIERYGRYYFITGRSISPSGVISLQLSEDVLTTNAALIKASKGQLKRSENKYNMYLTDDRLPRPKQAVFTTQKFPKTPFKGTMSDCGVIVGLLGAAKA